MTSTVPKDKSPSDLLSLPLYVSDMRQKPFMKLEKLKHHVVFNLKLHLLCRCNILRGNQSTPRLAYIQVCTGLTNTSVCFSINTLTHTCGCVPCSSFTGRENDYSSHSFESQFDLHLTFQIPNFISIGIVLYSENFLLTSGISALLQNAPVSCSGMKRSAGWWSDRKRVEIPIRLQPLTPPLQVSCHRQVSTRRNETVPLCVGTRLFIPGILPTRPLPAIDVYSPILCTHKKARHSKVRGL